jgi:hypothetical protein
VAVLKPANGQPKEQLKVFRSDMMLLEFQKISFGNNMKNKFEKQDIGARGQLRDLAIMNGEEASQRPQKTMDGLSSRKLNW